MSGPKIDAAELERRRLEEIERQRKERLRRIQIATDLLNDQYRMVRANISSVERDLAHEIAAHSGESEMEQVMNTLLCAKDEYLSSAEDLLGGVLPTEPDDITAYASKVAEKAKELLAAYNEISASCKKRIAEYEADKKRVEVFEAISFQDAQDIVVGVEDFDFGSLVDAIKAEPSIEEKAKEKVEILFRQLESLNNSDALSFDQRKGVQVLAKGLFEAAFKGESSLAAKVTECSIVVGQLEIAVDRFEELYQKYYAAYVDYWALVNQTRKDSLDIVPKERYEFESVDALYREIQLIEQESTLANKRAYIRQQIDEVMRLFHYNLTEEIVLRKNQDGAHYVCKSETGSTGIHLYLSDRDSLMMEVVGLGTSSSAQSEGVTGITVEGASLSKERREELLAEQGHFCDMHPQIIAELEKRGIVFSTLVHQPVDAKFCKEVQTVTNTDEELYDPHKLYHKPRKRRKHYEKDKEMAIKV